MDWNRIVNAGVDPTRQQSALNFRAAAVVHLDYI
jgi:hypothetical protein